MALPESKKILLISGGPGVGKSALIQTLASLVKKAARGFYTEPVIVEQQRVGFNVVGFNGMTQQAASLAMESTARVGKYGVDMPALEAVMREVLPVQPVSSDVYFIDELGKLECKSTHFCAFMQALLASQSVAVVTSPLKGSSLLEQYIQHDEVLRVKLHEQNHAQVMSAASAWLAKVGVA